MKLEEIFLCFLLRTFVFEERLDEIDIQFSYKSRLNLLPGTLPIWLLLIRSRFISYASKIQKKVKLGYII